MCESLRLRKHCIFAAWLERSRDLVEEVEGVEERKVREGVSAMVVLEAVREVYIR